MPEPWAIALLFLAGIGAGVVNTMVGGGSMLSLPALLFVGLPPLAANGTNRFALLGQTLAASISFHRQGFGRPELARRLGGPALVGSIAGAWLATRIPPDAFRVVIGLLLPGALLLFMARPDQRLDGDVASGEHPRFARLAFFALGIYGGFLGVAIGVMILTTLALTYRLDLVTSNAIKVVVNFLLSCTAFAVFLWADAIDWTSGLPLIAGNGLGALIGAHLSIRHGERWIKRLLAVVVVATSIKLLFF